MLKYGDVPVDPPLLLAPMAGVTDSDFRLIVRRIGGVGVVSMEFISSKAIVGRHHLVDKLMYFSQEERPLAIQIYGSDAATMAEAARVVEEIGADICDINMGCPANKVLKGLRGRRADGRPEARRGDHRQRQEGPDDPADGQVPARDADRRPELRRARKICEGSGVAAVAMHARTAKQMFSGEADWSHIARLKEALSIPVIGNGDVREPDDALRMMRETGCDGVMIARAATKNPWIFKQIQARMSGGAVAEPTLQDRRDLILGHFRMVAEREESRFALHKLRKFTGWYTHGLPHGRKLRQKINSLPDVESFLEAVERFFADLETSAAA